MVVRLYHAAAFILTVKLLPGEIMRPRTDTKVLQNQTIARNLE